MRYKALPISLRFDRSSIARGRVNRIPPQERRPRLRDKIATTLMLASLPVSLIVVFSALATGPALRYTGAAHPGVRITVNGTSLPPHDRIQLTWDGSASGMPLVRSDKSGSFVTDVTVPLSASVGGHVLAARSAKPQKGKRPNQAGSGQLATVTVYVTAAAPSATTTPSPTVKVTPSPTPTPKLTSSPTPTPKLTASPTPTAQPSSPGTSSIKHVVIVWLENHEYGAVTSTSMPYLTGLAGTYGLASNFYAVSHPSLPNYLAVWSGTTQGVTDDGTYNLGAANLSSQLTAAGKTWRAYQQTYPSTAGCHTASSYSSSTVDGWGVLGNYARKHDPAMSFTSVTGTAQCADNIKPLAQFTNAANVAFVTPNLCNDGHDCSLTTSDNFLKAFLPTVFASPNYQDGSTLLIVSFDEGSTNTNGGGHIYTMVARAGMTHQVSSTFHNHYGVTRTVENLFGLPCLANACNAAPLSEFLP